MCATTTIESQSDSDALQNENDFLKEYSKRHIPSDNDTNGKEESHTTLSNSLSLEEKLELGRKFVHELTQEQNRKQDTHETNIHHLQILLEETDMRLNELQRDAHEFQRDVLEEKDSDDPSKQTTRGGGRQNTMAEKVMDYITSKLAQKEKDLDKYQRKNHSLQIRKKKLGKRLEEKEKGGTLHYIDIHQLLIENKQLGNEIHQKNMELFGLKSKFTRATKNLDDIRQSISQTESDILSNSNALYTKQQHEMKIRNDTERLKHQLQKEKEIKRKRQESGSTNETGLENLDIPDIDDYMEQKKTMYKLRDEIKSYERKVEILQRGIHKTDC